jgi:hypothetical protein
MGKNEKRAYRRAIRARYRAASRAEKTRILDEFCEVCGYHRKYAVRLLSARERPEKRASRAGQASVYSAPGLVPTLKRVWLAADQPCGKRLVALLPLWLPADEARHGAYPAELKAQLESISAATVDRLLRPAKLRYPRKGLGGTKPGSILRSQIPIRTDHWDATRPGFIEADTVAHCGTSLAGNFVWSLTLTDICTAWTECRAVWNKGSGGVVEAIRNIERALPFDLIAFDCDNGSEFLNHHLVRYFATHPIRPSFTRSRPYHKNDNAHVEQKNWSHARQLLGYDRLEDPALVPLINDLYANEFSLLQNYFLPSLKLISKQRIGSKIKKRYSKPLTPYQRMLDHAEVAEETKARLRAVFATLDPFTLHATIQRKLKAIFKLVSVTGPARKRL